jgi:hypothetical protein
MFTAFESGGFCPALDDISLKYSNIRVFPIYHSRQRAEARNCRREGCYAWADPGTDKMSINSRAMRQIEYSTRDQIKSDQIQ